MTSDELVGLDIGGTTLKAVRVNADGAVLNRLTVTAGGRIPREDLLSIIEKTVAELDGGDAVRRIGIAVGGLVSADGVMPANVTNLANLANVPLASLFFSRLGRPCTIVNDARAAVHGEAWVGVAQGLRDAMIVTFGTGIGSGLLLGGQVREGAHGSAGEIGLWHHSIAAGSLEDSAAPVKFERQHGRALADALLDGEDAEGQAVLETIGRSLADAHLLLDLEAIIIGGGLSDRGEPLRAALDFAVRRNCPADMHNGLVVHLSALGAYAGAIGAVAPTMVSGVRA